MDRIPTRCVVRVARDALGLVESPARADNCNRSTDLVQRASKPRQ